MKIVLFEWDAFILLHYEHKLGNLVKQVCSKGDFLLGPFAS